MTVGVDYLVTKRTDAKIGPLGDISELIRRGLIDRPS